MCCLCVSTQGVACVVGLFEFVVGKDSKSVRCVQPLGVPVEYTLVEFPKIISILMNV